MDYHVWKCCTVVGKSVIYKHPQQQQQGNMCYHVLSYGWLEVFIYIVDVERPVNRYTLSPPPPPLPIRLWIWIYRGADLCILVYPPTLTPAVAWHMLLYILYIPCLFIYLLHANRFLVTVSNLTARIGIRISHTILSRYTIDEMWPLPPLRGHLEIT